MPTGPDKGSQNKSAAKADKAINAANKKSARKQKGGVPAAKGRQIPWLTVAGVVVVVGLVAGLGINLYPKYQDRAEAQKFEPSESNQDPSTDIDGVTVQEYPAALHVSRAQRVAYDQSPPFGGPHDAVWATCTGIVYPEAIRTENAVHSLEHGAVWVTYNPDDLNEDQVESLADRVDGETQMMMSPYPGLDSPVALQSWGHQLKLDSVDDERIGQFISALRLNRFAYPEVGASCASVPGTGDNAFDPDNPPLFDASAPGPDAVPMDGAGITPDASEIGGTGGLPGGAQLPSDLEVPAS
ncbi:DUF3105 domain-containing protein [Rhodococcus sp. NPDC078407]|uniref:DUF3105 domain-containing protein n=1 Tax=Rhodococcus sp. NPDC078407 TaxID=3364509 RepID=UPI0037C82D16